MAGCSVWALALGERYICRDGNSCAGEEGEGGKKEDGSFGKHLWVDPVVGRSEDLGDGVECRREQLRSTVAFISTEIPAPSAA